MAKDGVFVERIRPINSKVSEAADRDRVSTRSVQGRPLVLTYGSNMVILIFRRAVCLKKTGFF